MVFTELQAKLSLDSSGFRSGVDNARKSLGKLGDRANDIGRSMQGAGRKMSMGISAPIAGAAGGALKAAADFETAMVEVEKVASPETAEEMGDAIRDMAETMPLAQKELAGVAADAARFGVRGPKNIQSFTESVSKMAVATDLSSQQAGEALARIGNMTGVPADKMGNLGSAVNELSNNMATSASEITDAMLRSGAAASQFGLSAQETAGVSAALNAVSESSERAGTRMRRLLQESMNPKKVADLAGALGMTKDQFTDMRKNAPMDLLQKMIGAMASGGEEADALRSSLSTTSRQALSALAQDTGAVNDALDTSAKAFKENTSLQKEFDAASSTTNAQLQMLRNRLRNAAITVGNLLLPVINNLIDRLTPLIESFQGLSSRQQRLIVAAAGLAAALGPVIWILGTLITSAVTVAGALSTAAGLFGTLMAAVSGLLAPLGVVTSLLGSVLGVFAPLTAAISTVLAPLAGAASALGAVGASALAILGPIALVVAAVGALGYAFKHHGDLIKRVVGEALNYVTRMVSEAAAWLQANGPRLMKKAFKAIGTGIRVVLIDLYNAITGNGDSVIKSVLLDAAGWLRSNGPGILVSAFTFLVDLVFAAFEGLYEGLIGGSLIPDLFNDISDFIRGFDLAGAFEDAVDAALNKVESFGNDIRRAGRGLISALASGIRDKIDDVRDAAGDVADEARSYLPGSDADTGPLSDLTASGAALPETLASGMESNEQTVEQASKRTARKASPDPSADPATLPGAGTGSEELVAELHVDGNSAIEALFDVLEDDIEAKIKSREKSQKRRSKRLARRS